ncbi:hypothetical protein NEMBOFW57_004440 [Staphylotrichum longicolle]|uniref:ER-bound oxygenase mpaB/mpaB'/Rubber oxygenase catalytic domain-containing protein n=1 Tax=Staphylotrichum longicolle TaxID=669026 RepID=A0AAD4F7Z1_9PEZI|nr:hypothetical protein NEMBOFW57_004440 [Staphylotrichum longicolle]
MDASRPKVGACMTTWDYKFKWTEDHLTAEEMRPLMFTYDELATRSLDRFDDLAALHLRANRKPDDNGPGDPGHETQHPDLYEILSQRAHEDETLRELWDQVNTVPDWVDWAQIERGQKVFYRYAGPSIVGLTFQSLLGGMGSPRVVETLTRTGGFGVHVARRRLLETFQHVLDVTHSLPSLQPGPAAPGFASSIRVRLLHASVRRRILALARRQPSYFPTSAHGIPINDLDSIGTILAFSAAPIWLSLPRQGIYLRGPEIDDYLALWRYVAHLLGVPTHPFSSPPPARAWMESLLLADVAPSATSQTLGNNMLAALACQPPTYASADFLRAEAYWLNGPKLCTALGLAPPRWGHTLLVGAQCLLFMAVCYARRSVPAWDERGIARSRRVLKGFVVKQAGGTEARHEMQYVPELGKMETPADAPASPHHGGADTGRRGGGLWKGAEGRSLG